ncbi:outer membrane lipoprotein LolB [Neisseria sp. Ec49-e6-T10]|uniref:outer membrane lipoprotein LolB n=1 Tax=Neisseria sp. Ec49-e6-T10 TaxID=3140744 RepID=UPI003EBFFCC4
MQKFILSCCLLLLLSACSVFGPKQDRTRWQVAQEYEKAFSSNGRLSVNFNGRGYSAHFDWEKYADQEQLDVKTPLGSTVGQICKDQIGLVAVSGANKFYADSIDQLAKNLMGFDLPLENLPFWMQGIIVPNIPHHIDQEGNLQQMGWSIKRTVWADQPSKPRRLELTRKDLDIRIVFDDFTTLTDTQIHQLCQIRTENI